jgi:hypothetical protein
MNYKTVFLVYEVSPESVLLVTFLGSMISSLLIDPAITISTTYLYLQNRKEE